MSQTLTLPVHGMTCNGCVNSLTKALEASPAIDHATVQLSPGQVTLNYNPEAITEEDIRALIADAGFEARPST